MRHTTAVLLFAVGIGSAQAVPYARSRPARPPLHPLTQRSSESESWRSSTAAKTLEHSLDLIRGAYESIPFTEAQAFTASADIESITSKLRSERLVTVIHKIRSACVSALDSGTALLNEGIFK